MLKFFIKTHICKCFIFFGLTAAHVCVFYVSYGIDYPEVEEKYRAGAAISSKTDSIVRDSRFTIRNVGPARRAAFLASNFTFPLSSVCKDIPLSEPTVESLEELNDKPVDPHVVTKIDTMIENIVSDFFGNGNKMNYPFSPKTGAFSRKIERIDGAIWKNIEKLPQSLKQKPSPN